MRKTNTLRNFGLAAVALLAIGAVGYAASNGSSADDSDQAYSTAGSIGASAGGDAANLVKTEEALNDAPARDGESSAGSLGAGAPQSAPYPATASANIDRRIVSTASVQLQVENVGGSFEEVGRIATTAGGFIASSSFTYQDEDQLASVTIRVPSESYQSVLASLRRLGVKVDYENSDAQDVTEEYTDLGARLRTLEATESQLLTLLAKAETISDILTVQDRLNYTRTEIEQVKGRMQLLDNLTSLATITVHLRPAVAAGGSEPGEGVDLGAEVAEAWDNSIEFLGEIAAGIVTVVVFVWWLPLVGLPLLLGYRAVTRNKPQTAGVEVD
jgi:hypothetical protein